MGLTIRSINRFIVKSKSVYLSYTYTILAQNIVVQGLDDLLWALAEAENSTCNPSSIENYEDMRYTVSRILKKLVADLPDSDLLSE